MTGANTPDAAASLRRDALTCLLPGFVGPTAPEWLLGLLGEGLGGVCLFGTNVERPAQVARLTAAIRAANPDAVVAIDEEGGEVTRLAYDIGSPFPGAAVLGRIDDVAVTAAVADRVGRALRAVGANVTFAPDVDVNSNPDNPVIGTRSFGTDPELVGRHAAAWTRGVQTAGVAATPKHFPGHGDTAVDSHLGLPIVDLPLETLRERELVPFRAAIEAGAKLVMTSHILLPQLDADRPATLSPTILGMLRDELGFDGVIVSDALDMHGASGETGIPEAAVRALDAGCDLLCIGTANTGPQLEEITAHVLSAVADGRLSADRVAEAAARVRALAAGLPAPAAVPAPGEELDLDVEAASDERSRVGASFRVADAVPGVLAEAGRVGTLVGVETVANIAVGAAPWGPFAALAQDAAAPRSLADADTLVLAADAPAFEDARALTGPVLVVGRDLHRHAFARDAVDGLRAVRGDVVAVDFGWPSPDFAYADIATFGSSRLVGEAFLAALEGWTLGDAPGEGEQP
ncbi:glycoside hydrolase family 3 protein [Agromyces seonyuensis]|uniref:Glycoside hydrolase family 3 N-terminal domain-containing protein n=1 Tax=Agromyces seonyuensis TaxID=2662446 RepID=A0A6I4NWK9_9MICO|nr:glycoside hydrolase family 3 N-terminal domain-containing protein [Agromyces seonyuensis]MWB98786.1 hypothetical protein [Agromyces seonyuensis]